MAAYLREVQRHPLLTPEQTHEIAVQFVGSQSPALAAKLVTSNLRLVVKIAYEYRRAYKNIMDLVQEGNIGLMQAVKRYDPYRNVKLSSYAAWWIRAYILRFILNNWRLVKLGTTQAQRKLFFNLRKKRAELAALGIDPTHEEIAKSLNVPESDVAEMDVRLSSNERSLDAPVGAGDAEGRSIARVDMMPSLSSGPETLVAGEELQVLLKDKLAEFRETLAGKEKGSGHLRRAPGRRRSAHPAGARRPLRHLARARAAARAAPHRQAPRLSRAGDGRRRARSVAGGDGRLLYIVATPIGNLGDLTPRAVETLRLVDRIAAEDTRRTRGLLTHLEITGKPLDRLDAHSGPADVEQLVERMKNGETVALVTDAGTPAVSDPGEALTRACIVAGVRVVPIPGASAVLVALVGSGLAGRRLSLRRLPSAARSASGADAIVLASAARARR